MTTHPRTPVLVGVGQVTNRPATPTYESRPQPLDLMVEALELALLDTGRAPRALDALEELVAIGSFTWHTSDPARLVGERLGRSDLRTRLTPTGGNIPQKLVHESAQRIARGEVTTIAVVGSEAMYAHSLARREGRAVDWLVQGSDVATPDLVEEDRIPFTADEYEQGLTLPVEVYPLFENARRARRGWSPLEQRDHLGRLWANFAAVAATNPYAWLRDAPSPETIATPSASNRMVAFPYTKLLVANLPVDMGAAYLMTSYEEAVRWGVATDRLVFPQSGADANDHWFVSERPELDDSPAMRAIWDALRSSGEDADAFNLLDLYSCFPTVVQTACDVLGIDAFSTSRVPTLTGGLTFGGGPGNNYVTHAIAQMVDGLREHGGRGLVSGLGWFSTKHAWGTYATTPPASGFSWRNVQEVVDRGPRVVAAAREGALTIESYTVIHGRDGAPRRLVAAGRTSDHTRVWCHSVDPDLMAEAETNELIGRHGDVRAGVLSL